MPTANTRACFEHFIGQQLVGEVDDEDAGTRILVFEDGTGLAFSINAPGYWHVPASDVRRVVDKLVRKYDDAKQTYDALVALAGDPPASGSTEEASDG